MLLLPAITVVWSPSSHVQLNSRISRRLPPASVIFFAAAVMNVRRPECEEAPFNPSIPISRNRVQNQTAIALAL